MFDYWMGHRASRRQSLVVSRLLWLYWALAAAAAGLILVGDNVIGATGPRTVIGGLLAATALLAVLMTTVSGVRVRTASLALALMFDISLTSIAFVAANPLVDVVVCLNFALVTAYLATVHNFQVVVAQLVLIAAVIGWRGALAISAGSDGHTALLSSIYVAATAAAAGLSILNVRQYLNDEVRTLHNDRLTGLMNQAGLLRILRAMLSSRRSESHGLSVVLFRVDGFDRLNTSYGSWISDDVLSGMTRSLSSRLGDDAVLARLAENEFAVITPSESAARGIAQAIGAAARGVYAEIPALTEVVTASVGAVVLNPSDFLGVNKTVRRSLGPHLISQADRVVHRVESAGGNGWASAHASVPISVAQMPTPPKRLRLNSATAWDSDRFVRSSARLATTFGSGSDALRFTEIARRLGMVWLAVFSVAMVASDSPSSSRMMTVIVSFIILVILTISPRDWLRGHELIARASTVTLYAAVIAIALVSPIPLAALAIVMIVGLQSNVVHRPLDRFVYGLCTIAVILLVTTLIDNPWLHGFAIPPTTVKVWTLFTVISMAVVIPAVFARMSESMEIDVLAASIDSLTGTYNPAGMQRAVRTWSYCLRDRRARPTRLALAVINLDNFKQINTKHGHFYGDAMIVRAATKIRAILDDAGVYGLIARRNADEFVVIASDTDPWPNAAAALHTPGLATPVVTSSMGGAREESLTEITDRLRRALRDLYPGLTASIGATVVGEAATTNDYEMAAATVEADHMMRMVKDSGGDDVGIASAAPWVHVSAFASGCREVLESDGDATQEADTTGAASMFGLRDAAAMAEDSASAEDLAPAETMDEPLVAVEAVSAAEPVVTEPATGSEDQALPVGDEQRWIPAEFDEHCLVDESGELQVDPDRSYSVESVSEEVWIASVTEPITTAGEATAPDGLMPSSATDENEQEFRPNSGITQVDS